MYGLKDASRISNDLLTEQFCDAVLTKMDSAPCVLKTKDTLVITCVNDLLQFSNYGDTSEQLKRRLELKFVLKDFGEAKHFFGMEMEYHPDLQVRMRYAILIDNLYV